MVGILAHLTDLRIRLINDGWIAIPPYETSLAKKFFTRFFINNKKGGVMAISGVNNSTQLSNKKTLSIGPKTKQIINISTMTITTCVGGWLIGDRIYNTRKLSKNWKLLANELGGEKIEQLKKVIKNHSFDRRVKISELLKRNINQIKTNSDEFFNQNIEEIKKITKPTETKTNSNQSIIDDLSSFVSAAMD